MRNKNANVNVIVNHDANRLWDLTMSNVQNVGNKSFVFAPMELLYVDARFQRVEDGSCAKINQLAREWDENQLDPLTGSLHPEECLISVIDGYHRIEAAKQLNLPGLVVEIAKGLPSDPAERLVAEATLFATQMDNVSVLTPVQKHRANVLRGIKENVAIEELSVKYNIPLKANLRARGQKLIGHLTGFTHALAIAKVSGADMLDEVLRILCEARWNLAEYGLGANALHVVYNIMRLHPQRTDIATTLVALLTDVDPSQLFAQAYAKYPTRKEKERILMYVEDMVCEKLNIARVYTGGSITTVLNKTA